LVSCKLHERPSCILHFAWSGTIQWNHLPALRFTVFNSLVQIQNISKTACTAQEPLTYFRFHRTPPDNKKELTGARMSDTITWGMMLRKLPSIAKTIPRVVKGMKVANVKDPTQPCGLGWTFEQAALRNPDGPALLQGDVVLSYAQVNQWANRIAHHLIAQGVGKGDVVRFSSRTARNCW
jgi:hypothetical protein